MLVYGLVSFLDIGILFVTIVLKLCFKAAADKDEHKDYGFSSSMAKVYASEAAMWISTEAVQVHGGYGFVKEYHVERLMRDAKITQIYEGTSEIQRIVISRHILTN